MSQQFDPHPFLAAKGQAYCKICGARKVNPWHNSNVVPMDISIINATPAATPPQVTPVATRKPFMWTKPFKSKSSKWYNLGMSPEFKKHIIDIAKGALAAACSAFALALLNYLTAHVPVLTTYSTMAGAAILAIKVW